MSCQGDLDALCGAYAILNALMRVKSVKNFIAKESELHANASKDIREILFKKITQCAAHKQCFLTDGVTGPELNAVLVELSRSLPFEIRKYAYENRPDVRSLGNQTRYVLEEENGGVILSYKRQKNGEVLFSHWVSVERISPETDTLYPENDNVARIINITVTTSNDQNAARVNQIMADEVFFVTGRG